MLRICQNVMNNLINLINLFYFIYLSEFCIQLFTLAGFCLGLDLNVMVSWFQKKIHNQSVEKFTCCLMILITFYMIKQLVWICLYHRLVVTTHINVDPIIQPPSLFICLDDRKLFTTPTELLRQAVSQIRIQFYAENGTLAKFEPSRNTSSLPSIDLRINRSYYLYCFQMHLRWSVNVLDPNTPIELFTLTMDNVWNTFLVYIGHPRMLYPHHLLRTSSTFTYIHVQTVYLNQNDCPQRRMMNIQRQKVMAYRRHFGHDDDNNDVEKAWMDWQYEEKLDQDCIQDDYIPFMIFEQENGLNFRIFTTGKKLKLVISDEFSISRLVILTLSTLEALLNVTFNKSTLNLLRKLTVWIKTRKSFKRPKSRVKPLKAFHSNHSTLDPFALNYFWYHMDSVYRGKKIVSNPLKGGISSLEEVQVRV